MIGSTSSLAFRAVLKSAASRGRLDHAMARLTGLTPAALAFHAAAVSLDEPLVVIVPTDADVDGFTTDARFFFAAMTGTGEHDVAQRVLPFPSQEVDPYRGLSPHLEVASARARALHGLATSTASLVVMSARALLPRLSDPERLGGAGLAIVPGLEMSPIELGERLAPLDSFPRIRWTSQVSSASAAAWSISIRRSTPTRSASSSLATS